MGNLNSVTFNSETGGLDLESVITAIGLDTYLGAWMGLKTIGREANANRPISLLLLVLACDRSYLALAELADGLPDGLLFGGQLERHTPSNGRRP